jgi:cytochrome b561
MQWRNNDVRWGAIAQLLHWLIAFAIVGQMVLGWVMVSWRLSPTKFELYAIHKSLGITLLLLVLIRLAWRAGNVTPQAPVRSPRWEIRAAGASHTLLYVLMLAMPLSGYLINSASNFPLMIWGVLPLPNLTGENEPLQLVAEYVHLVLFWTLAALVLLHAAAALRHHWALKDTVLRRMLPGFRRTEEG